MNGTRSRISSLAFAALPLLFPITLRAVETSAADTPPVHVENSHEDSIQQHQNEELRLKKIISEQDTIVLGTVESVEPRGADWNKFDQRKWKITVKVDEVMKGEPVKSRQLSIYIRNPERAFSTDTPENVLKGRRCLWALTRQEDVVITAEALFPMQVFNDEDVKHLRALVKDAEKAKP